MPAPPRDRPARDPRPPTTPSRRALLSAGATTVVAALAGCSEIEGLGTDRPARDGTPAVPAGRPAADPGAAALATARDALADGQATLDAFVDRLPPVYADAEPPSGVPTDRVEDGLAVARSALDRVGSDQPEDRRRAAAALGGYADFQRAALDYLAAYLPVLHDVDAYRAYRLAERYEPAAAALSSASDGLGGLSSPRSAATSAASDVDRDALAGAGLRLSASSLPGWLADAAARERFAKRLVTGLASEVGALPTLREAHAAYDDERYSTAEERFLSAGSGFSEARRTFVNLEDGQAARPGATDVAVQYACRAGGLTTHCEEMATAARAVQFGQTAEVEAATERARAARERAAECSPSG